MTFAGNALATGIGTLPHRDPQRAVTLVLNTFTEAPFWPQLSKRRFLEQMLVQFTEGMPGIVIDEKAGRIGFHTPDPDAQAGFYEHYLSGDLAHFQISEEYAAGLQPFLHAVRSSGEAPRFIKGHVVGPITFGLSVQTENRRGLIYDDIAADIAIKCLEMKARWQIALFRSLGAYPIIFVDEPYLSSFGSPFISLTRERIIHIFNQLIRPLKEAGAIVGIHCCGNTEWPMLFETETDIVSFDAWGYFDGLACYSGELATFLARGGAIAWGIAPTLGYTGTETAEALAEKMVGQFETLARKGISTKTLLAQSLVTPSCGLGPISDESAAEQILSLPPRISRALRNGTA
ncbi:MAG: hypothetical protein Kow0099_02500 [Candidatus Abyssubacteria bacterium]